MNNTKIFIGGLNYATTENTLRDELSKYGELMSLRIVTDYETGRSKGFGFAIYKNKESAEKAIQSLNNTVFDGRRIGVKPDIKGKR